MYTIVAHSCCFLSIDTVSLTKMAPSILIDDLFAALTPSDTGIKSDSLKPAAKNSFFDHKQDWQQESSFATSLTGLDICGHGRENEA